jgi:hypothetical protein
MREIAEIQADIAYHEAKIEKYENRPEITIAPEVYNRLAELHNELRAVQSDGISIERHAEICTAERDNRCVVLPCKVGTRVWVIGQNCDLCRDMYAEEPCLFGSCEYKEVFESVFGYGMIDNFGKTVFLTRAEAEAALKGAEHE